MTIIACAVVIVLLFLAALGPVIFASVAMLIAMGSSNRGTTVVGGYNKRSKTHGRPARSISVGELADVTRPLTYIVDTDVFGPEILDGYMPPDQWKRLDAASADYADFTFIISTPSNRPTRSAKIPTKLKYRLSADELTDKVKFHKQMGCLRPQYVMKSYELVASSYAPVNVPVWIMRANWGWKGSANVIIRNTDELRAAYPKLARDHNSRVLLSEYIMNPLLRDGHKFHARVVIVVGVISKENTVRKLAVMLPLVETIIAPKPYRTDDFSDHDIHDTHYGPAVSSGFIEPHEKLYTDTVDCMKHTFTDMLPLIDKYTESPAAYDIFGADIMYKHDGSPIILEINKLPGLGFDNPDINSRAVDEIINGVMVAAVDPSFGTTCGRQESVITLADIRGPAVDPNPPRTFMCIGDQFDMSEIARYLPGWRLITNIAPYVDLVINAGEAAATGKLYKVRAKVKHRLNMKNITNKVRLHENLIKLAPHVIPETFRVSDSSSIDPDTLWIVRASWGFAGQSVKIASTTEEMQKIRREFINKHPRGKKLDDHEVDEVIATRYIENPMLINGRKFNLRIIMVAIVHSPEAVAKGSPQKAIYMLRKGNITTAARPYSNADFSNQEIHITHTFAENVRDHFHKAYEGDYEAMMDKIQLLLTDAVSPLIDTIQSYPESPAAYEILGADIIIDAGGRPYLVEINDIPGINWLKVVRDGTAEYASAYLDNLFHIIGPEFDMDVPSEYSVLLASIPAVSGGYQSHTSYKQIMRAQANAANPGKISARGSIDHGGRGHRAQLTAEDIEKLSKSEFPYYNLFKSETEVDAAFALVRDYRLKIVPAEYNIINIPELTAADKQFRGKSLLCEMSPDDYHKMNWMSDWFNESSRIRCKRYDEAQTQLEYYSEHRRDNRGASIAQIRDNVYENVRGCNNFRPGLLSGMVKAIGAQSVLDISAGWGDRLIGTIAAGVRYVGVDPNPDVHPGYKKIIAKFARDPTKYTMIESPFETAELPDETFDLVMTSPPYWKLEIYTDAPGQSVESHPDDWFDGFLIASAKKAWARINPGGYMVLVINNTRGEPDYVIKMRDIINQFESADYHGLLPYADQVGRGGIIRYKSPQPMWIWQKRDTISIKPLSAAHIDRIVELTHEPGMKYIANGKPWSRDKVEKLISYGDAEDERPQYAHYAIMYGSLVVGYIGWYPLEHIPDAIQLRVFISQFEQGRGFGLSAIKLLIDEQSRRYPGAALYMQMVPENTGSMKLAQKAGFTQLDGEYKINNTVVARWKL